MRNIDCPMFGVSNAAQTKRASRLPILMYHSIGDHAGTSPLRGLHTTLRRFAAHMAYLRKHGYRTLTLEQALTSLNGSGPPGKVLVITFDDGYEDFYSHAFPVLLQYGLTATVFAIAAFVGNRPTSSNPHAYMSWPQLWEIQRHGFTIASHSLTHPQLQQLSTAHIDTELHHSKQILEAGLGTEVRSFAYPYGFPARDRAFTAYITRRLEFFGYETAVSTLLGRAGVHNNRYLLPRIPMSSWDGDSILAAKLCGAYDWLRVVQGARKRLFPGGHAHPGVRSQAEV